MCEMCGQTASKPRKYRDMIICNECRNTCEACGQSANNPRRRQDMIICDECRRLPEYAYVAQSTAKKRYRLTVKDLADTPFVETKNPHYKCAPAMKLYLECDVIRVACQKHGCTQSQLSEVLGRV